MSLDVNDLGALLVLARVRGLRVFGARAVAPELTECDAWDECVVAWLWSHACCAADPEVSVDVQLCVLARDAFMLSMRVPRCEGAVSAQAAAAMLGWNIDRLRALEAAGGVRTVRRGDARRVPLDEVERLREPAEMTPDEVDALLARCATMR
jgi:hypothetical protein